MHILNIQYQYITTVSVEHLLKVREGMRGSVRDMVLVESLDRRDLLKLLRRLQLNYNVECVDIFRLGVLEG